MTSMPFTFKKLDIPEVILVEAKSFSDERGFFLESYHQERYRKEAGIKEVFVQDNHSHSTKGVLRGLHFQKTKPQGKLVSVTQGEVFDVAVDINPDSPTFTRWVGITITGTSACTQYRSFTWEGTCWSPERA